MANVYVYSGAAGAGTGADWTNAYVNLSSISAKAAGDIIYVAHDHAQTQATALTIASPGTEASPCRIYCVDRAGSVPPVAADLRTTATVTTTGANNISLHGCVSECYGIIFSAGSSTSDASISCGSIPSLTWRLVNCALRLMGANAASRIQMGGNVAFNPVILENTTVQFGHISQRLSCGSKLTWRNTPSAITGSTIPTELLSPSTSVGAVIFVEGVDLSAVAGGSSVIVRVADLQNATITLKDCKLGTGAIASASPKSSLGGLYVIRCDSGDTNYRTESWDFYGTQTTDTGNVRTGGASDGTTSISWQLSTTANANKQAPLESLPITVWNEVTGSPVTVTVQGIRGTGGAAIPDNDEVWIECQYLGTSGFPIASMATSGKANGLASATTYSAGSGTWSGGGTKFAMTATFTPQEKGPITIYVKAGATSTAFTIDPKPVIT